MNSLRIALLSAAENYSESEQAIIRNLTASSISVAPDRIIWPFGTDNHGVPDIPLDIFRDLFDKYHDDSQNPFLWLLGRTEGVTKFFEKFSGCDALGGAGSFLSFVSHGMDIFNHDPSSKEFWSAIFGAGSDGSGIAECVFGLMKKTDGKVCSGLLGGFLGMCSEGIDLIDMSITEGMKNAGGFIHEGGEFVTKLIGSDLKGWEAVGQNTRLSAITSCLTMGAYAIGDLCERGADGSISWNDIAQTSLGTGITGAASLIEGVTFGIVDIDAENANDIFNKNIEYMTNAISNTGAPTWAQLAMTIPGAVTVTAVSALEVVGDHLSDSWNSFTSLFR